MRPAALVHGIVGLATCLCLLGFYAGTDSLGAVNDVGNAVFGVLSLVLAWLLRADLLFFGLAAIGAVLTVVGTVLVMSETTGFYLAGLVSGLGFALIGGWLVAVNRRTPPALRLRRSGLIAGGVMLLGLIGAPGIALRIDIMETAPWWTFVAGFSWAGTYLLFPVWSLRLAGQDRSERLG